MLKIIYAILSLILTAAPAFAQTTTFGSEPCNAAITISGGGLTLTSSSASGDKYCLANVGKYIKDVYNSGVGLFYYSFTPSSTITSQTYGFSSGPTIPSGLTAISNAIMGFGNGDPGTAGSDSGIGYHSASSAGALNWYSTALATGIGSVSNGVTGAAVVNLNTDPPEVWVTPNIASLTCNGSGSSGSTRPKWNGSCASDPSLPGSGAPGDGTGGLAYIQGLQFFPAVTLGANDSATFSFADNATLDTYLPAGYLAWNDTSGAACSFPCPTDTVTINIADAPRYTNSAPMTQGVAASHTVASRIVAGPGCTKTTWTPGSACWLWQATNSGATSSSGDPTGSWSCTTSAGHGGFYATSFPGASTQTDNGVVFACLVAIDYPSILQASVDVATNWAAGIGSCTVHGAGCYWQHEFVRNAGNIYQNIQSNFVSPYLCVSAGVAPTGTGQTTDGTCQWNFIVTPTYSSHSPYWTPVFFVGPGPAEMTYAHYTTLLLWGGGHEVPQYQAGSNGEADPISLGRHQGEFAEAPGFCLHGYNVQQFAQAPQCVGQFNTELVRPAVGDGFADNMASTDPLQPNASYGVKIYNSNTYSGTGAGSALQLFDRGTQLSGLIVQSVQGIGVDGVFSNNFTDNSSFNNLMVEAGGPAVLTSDAGTGVTNSLVMLDSTAPAGSVAIFIKYPALLSYNTIVCAPGLTHSLAIGFFADNPVAYGFGNNIPWVGNAYFGCVDPWAAKGVGSGWELFTPPFANFAANATDILSSYTPGTVVATPASGGVNLTTYTIPGTTYNLSESANLTNPTFGSSFDARIKSTSADLYGAGVNYNFVSGYNGFGLFPNNGVFSPGSDIFNVSRPVSGRYDIGAAMFSGSLPPPSPGLGGGRSFFH